MSNELFIRATRQKWRFPSNAGLLTVEQLWDLPLTNRTGLNLDAVAKTINAELKAAAEESFVSTKPNPTADSLAERLELVKFIIATKIADDQARAERAEKRAKRERILQALAAHEETALASASKEDLLKQLQELDN